MGTVSDLDELREAEIESNEEKPKEAEVKEEPAPEEKKE